MKRCCETCEHYTAIGRYYDDGRGGDDFIETKRGRCWENDEIVCEESDPCDNYLERD